MNKQPTSTQPTDEQRRQLTAALASTISAEQQAFNHRQWDKVLAWNAQQQKAKKESK